MFFSEDRQELNAAKQQNYVNACLSEFEERSVNDTNQAQARTLEAWSYLPNIVSLVTAGFFIFYLLIDYTLWVKIVLGFLLLAVAGTVELGKRGLIGEAGKRYFPTEKLPGGLLAGIAVLMLCSMVASYIGGNKLVTENAHTPPMEVNPQIDSLKAQLAQELTVSESFRKTTWKGKITRGATQGMNESRKEQTRLNAKIDELESLDNMAYQTVLSGHTSKISNFGIVLGIVAILADVALFFLLWTVKRLRYEIALLAFKAAQAAKREREEAEAQARKEAQQAAAQQSQPPPYQGQQPPGANYNLQNNNQPTLYNQQRQLIGFKAPTHQGQPLPPPPPQPNAMRNNESPNAMRKEREKANGKLKGCVNCGKEFEARTTWHKYCCEECKIEAWEARTGKKFKRRKK